MGATLLITTIGRPEELQRCLCSIVAQSVLPEEIVLVDASDPPQEEQHLQAIAGARGIPLVFIAAAPGRTRQLNIGIRASRGDPVIIVDDDAELEPGFVEAMVEAFDTWGPQLGAVQGTMVNDVYRRGPSRTLRWLFLMSRHTDHAPGRVLPSGYYTIPVRPSRPTEAEAVRLGATGFRRQVLEEFTLDESLDGYALKEDVDLSYRISRRYKVLILPDARFNHYKTPTTRINQRQRSTMHVVNNFWFFSKHLRGSAFNDLAFAWSMVGRLFTEVLRTLVKRDPAYVRGTLEGFATVYRDRQRAKRAGSARG